MSVLLVSNWDFTLNNYDSVWKVIIQIGLLLFFLLIGNVLRTTISFFKKGLVPSTLIGGFLLLAASIIYKAITGNELLDKSLMQVITYHGLGIGFVAMTLKSNNNKNKSITIKAIENGAMTGATYMLQAFVGMLVTIVLYLVTKNSSNTIFYASGVILPLGFGQGPGNALTWDLAFSSLENGTLFQGNGSFGLTISSIGFVVASVFGVLYIDFFRKKGEIVPKNKKDVVKDVSYFETNNEIEDSDSVDKSSIQIGLVLLGYGMAFLIMFFFAKLSDFTNGIAWGFNFIWGVIAANLIKLFLNVLKKHQVVKKEYINNYQMDRISGFAFDIMIVAGVAAIEIDNVRKYIVPLVLLCVIGTIVTFIYIRIVTKKLFKGYEHEVFVTNFGTLTGTASNGMVLLKEIDPNFETPTVNQFVVSQLPAMLFVAPLLLLLNFSCKSFTNACIACAIFALLFISYNIFLFRKKSQ